MLSCYLSLAWSTLHQQMRYNFKFFFSVTTHILVLYPVDFFKACSWYRDGARFAQYASTCRALISWNMVSILSCLICSNWFIGLCPYYPILPNQGLSTSGRETPSVACIVQPGQVGGFQKLFFGKEEIAIPVVNRSEVVLDGLWVNSTVHGPGRENWNNRSQTWERSR